MINRLLLRNINYIILVNYKKFCIIVTNGEDPNVEVGKCS